MKAWGTVYPYHGSYMFTVGATRKPRSLAKAKLRVLPSPHANAFVMSTFELDGPELECFPHGHLYAVRELAATFYAVALPVGAGHSGAFDSWPAQQKAACHSLLEAYMKAFAHTLDIVDSARTRMGTFQAVPTPNRGDQMAWRVEQRQHITGRQTMHTLSLMELQHSHRWDSTLASLHEDHPLAEIVVVALSFGSDHPYEVLVPRGQTSLVPRELAQQVRFSNVGLCAELSPPAGQLLSLAHDPMLKFVQRARHKIKHRLPSYERQKPYWFPVLACEQVLNFQHNHWHAIQQASHEIFEEALARSGANGRARGGWG